MPIVKPMPGVKAPKEPYLAVHLGEGQIVALPRGTTFFQCVGDDATPMTLVKVAERTITFRCACGNPDCTRVMKYSRVVTGFHPNKYTDRS